MKLLFENQPTALQSGDVALVYVESKTSIVHVCFQRNGKDINVDPDSIAILSSPDQPEALMNIIAACCGLRNQRLDQTDLENRRFIFI